MTIEWRLTDLDVAAIGRFGGALALVLRRGDVVTLAGELGAGKTTFARAVIEALAAAPIEIASPTFSIVQTYDETRLPVAHYDLYRLAGAEEAADIGLLDGMALTVTLIEWADRAAALLPQSRLQIHIAERAQAAGGDSDRRDVVLTAFGDWDGRLRRLQAMLDVAAMAGFAAADWRHLAGDASRRSYGRLVDDGRSVVLMDWPPPTTPAAIVTGGKSYPEIAHITDEPGPFVAIAGALAAAGLTVPTVRAADLDHGVLVLDDLGDNTFAQALTTGMPMRELYCTAIDLLVALAGRQPPATIAIDERRSHQLPAYDRGALDIELSLLADWYWPFLGRGQLPAAARAEFAALWQPLVGEAIAEPAGWVLRDFHSPNLLWLPRLAGIARVGVIDFQDALRGPAAYDVASLLQDARLDVPAALEGELLDHYFACRRVADPRFDAERFRLVYAILGAQRATKILGIFARLHVRDGKRGYLQHMPRVWNYLERNLRHPGLQALETFMIRNFPVEQRRRLA